MPVVPRERVYGGLDAGEIEKIKAEAWAEGYSVAETVLRTKIYYGWSPEVKPPIGGILLFHKLLEGVAEKHGVPTEAIRGDTRARHVIRARHEFMWRARHELGRSNSQIGDYLGGKDHTTVTNGVQRHQARIDAGEA